MRRVMRAGSHLVFAAVAAIASVSAASAGAVTDGHAAARSTTSLNGWVKVSTGTPGIIDSLGLARFGSQLQAVWTEDVGAHQTLATATVSGSGHVRMAAERVFPAPWAAVNEYPVIFGSGSFRQIGFSGVQDNSTSNPYSQGYEYLLNSTDSGHTWALTDTAITQSARAYASYGTDLVDPGGTPTVAYTDGSAERISYHTGFITPIPETPATDPTLHPTGPFAYYTGLGYDSASGQGWAVWYSNSGKKNTDGIDAQRILPSVGTSVVHAPGSTIPSGSGYISIPINHRIVVTARAGGGLYAAYVEGYPSAKRIAVWRIGTPHVITINPHGDVIALGAAAGPGGQIWLYWANQSAGAVNVVRTNPAATRFGAACSQATPGRTTEVWDLVGNAAAGPLTLFADAGGSPGIYDRLIKPCLSVTAKPHSVSRGGSVTVTVSDAGAAVRRAAVHFAGTTKNTNRHGKVTFRIPARAKRGRHLISVSTAGYRHVSAHITVT